MPVQRLTWLGFVLPVLMIACSDRATCPDDDEEATLTSLPYYRLTEGGAECFDWSEDGEAILIRQEDEIRSIDAKTGAFLARHTSRDSFDIANVLWFSIQHVNYPIKNSILFFSNHKPNLYSSLYLMEPGGVYELILTPFLPYILSFSASKDCRLIVYYENDWRRRYPDYLRIWKRGEGVVETHYGSSLEVTTAPIIKIDPEGLYFDYSGQSWTYDGFQIQRWNIADSSRTLICEVNSRITGFDRSPDGKSYVLSLSWWIEHEYLSNIYLMPADRPNTTYQITALTKGTAIRPVFSPDGASIACTVESGPVPRGIYVIDLRQPLAVSVRR